MTTKSDLIAAIQDAADAYYIAPGVDPDAAAAIKIALGSPGVSVEIAGRQMQSGAAWTAEPKPFPTLIEGIADWLDAAGVGGVSSIKSKVNEIVSAYMQLKQDYNSSTLPTSANDITEIP
jgi:hypothetical protein